MSYDYANYFKIKEFFDMNIAKWLVREIHRSAKKLFLKVYYSKPFEYKAKAFSLPLSNLKRIAFIDGCPDNRSDRYRVKNVAEAIALKGILVDCYYCLNLNYLLKHVDDYDLLIIFRAKYDEKGMAEVIDKFKLENIPVVYDTDDLIFCPEIVDQIAGIKDLSEEKKDSYVHGLMSYKKAMLCCDAATFTTDFLKRQATNIGVSNTYILKNTIDPRQYALAQKLNKTKIKSGEKVKICYLSGTATHNMDFKSAEKALLSLLKEYKNLELHIVGPLELDKAFNEYKKQIKRKKYMNYLSLLKYSAKMDINIAPLELENPYNEGKSEIKIFESALVKVPSVVSSTDAYSRCITDGKNGYLAKNEEDWYRYLKMLVESKELRESIGQAAYDDMVEKYYINNNIDEIVAIYHKIYEEKRCAKVNE